MIPPQAVKPPLDPPASGQTPLDPPASGQTPLDPPASGGKEETPSPLAGKVGMGFIPIESLRPGDWVFAHDGLPHRVLRVIKRKYHNQLIGFRCENSESTLWITPDHLILSERRVKALSAEGEWSAVSEKHFESARILRKDMSPPEKKLWKLLRQKQFGVKFRRQHPIGPYISDFYSRDAGLVVEVDGSQHGATADSVGYDQVRDEYMKGLGLEVLRLPASDVIRDSDSVLQQIGVATQERILPENSGKQWRYATHLEVGDVVFSGINQNPSKITSKEKQEYLGEVYDLEVEEAHSFLTEVCAVHNCGSGTTAYVAEQWGRRWITIDCSRVPLALARQRLLTATFPYYELRQEEEGVKGGFKYVRKQNAKGEEIGGIVPHVTLKSIAQNEPPQEEVLVDKPEVEAKIVRVSGPFCVEATIPTPVDWEADGEEDSLVVSGEEITDHNLRMLETLRKSPVIRLPGNQTIEFKSVRKPANALMIHAEAELVQKTLEDLAEETENQKRINLKPSTLVAFIFGPVNGAVSEQLVYQSAKEANAKNYTHLYVIGFACQDAARKLIDQSKQVLGIPATYVNATMDIQMGDLLKSTKSSQLFSVTGSPEVRLIKLKEKSKEGDTLYQVELLGLDVYYPPGYDPEDSEANDVLHENGKNVPAWFLDTNYNDLCFYVSQAFFPRTQAWDNLKKDLKGQYDDSLWEHLAGTISEPFISGDNERIAVKVIDDRGNELLVVKSLDEAEEEK